MGNSKSRIDLVNYGKDDYELKVHDICSSMETLVEDIAKTIDKLKSLALSHEEKIKHKEISDDFQSLEKNRDIFSKRLQNLETFLKFTKVLENLQGYVVQNPQHGQPTPPGNQFDAAPGLSDTLNETKDRCIALDMENTELKQENKRLQDRIKRLEADLAKFKPIQIIQKVFVQILQRSHGELIDKVVNELISMLQGSFSSENIEFRCRKYENPGNVQNNLPLLVVCINASRLGLDAESAVSGIQGSVMTGLLIFHHKDVQTVAISPSDQTLKSDQFQRMGGIFDFAFLQGNGIYPCQMNDVSLKKVKRFIYMSNKTSAELASSRSPVTNM